MSENTARFLTNGTSALDSSVSYRRDIATIIQFPRRECRIVRPFDARQTQLATSIKQHNTVADSIRSHVKDVLEASEMYCSMKYEDVRGCAYRVFTRASIGTLVFSGSVIAAVALFFGA